MSVKAIRSYQMGRDLTVNKGETLLNILSPTRAERVLRSMYRCKVILS